MIELGPSGWAIVGFIVVVVSILGSHLVARWQRKRALYSSLAEPYDQSLTPKNHGNRVDSA